MFKNTYIIFDILLTLTATAVAQQDETVLRDVLLGRFTKLQNLIVNYRVTTEFTPQKTDEQAVTKLGEKIMLIKKGTQVATKEFSIFTLPVKQTQFSGHYYSTGLSFSQWAY